MTNSVKLYLTAFKNQGGEGLKSQYECLRLFFANISNNVFD